MFTGDYCGGMGPAGWLLMIGFWAAIIAVIVWAVTRLFPKASTGRRSPAAPQRRRDPQELLLDQRLASDEIDPQTYIAARRELTGTGQGGGPATTAPATTAGPTCRCP
jgi:putative membrane protein